MTSLKSIDVLISSIHTCFPPAFGVQGHVYFSKWKSIPVTYLRGAVAGNNNNALDEKKLEKSVKKLKFFLHPDKLPRDLDAQQAFMCICCGMSLQMRTRSIDRGGISWIG